MKNAWRNIELNKARALAVVEKYRKIAVFDTETTGLDGKAKIIQFSGVLYNVDTDLSLHSGEEVDIYINPEEPLPDKIIEITGITDEMLKTAPTEKEAVHGISAFLASAPIWAAYNSPFDLRMLSQMAGRLGVKFTPRPTLDVLVMARDCIPKTELESHKLEDVAQYLFPEETIQFHSAINDTKATGLALEAFLKMYKGAPPPEAKRTVRLNWAAYTVNPRKNSQVRIKLNLAEGDYGDIFWDVINKTWSCKDSPEAAALFRGIDLGNLEGQVLSRYGGGSMDGLAARWGKRKRESARKSITRHL